MPQCFLTSVAHSHHLCLTSGTGIYGPLSSNPRLAQPELGAVRTCRHLRLPESWAQGPSPHRGALPPLRDLRGPDLLRIRPHVHGEAALPPGESHRPLHARTCTHGTPSQMPMRPEIQNTHRVTKSPPAGSRAARPPLMGRGSSDGLFPQSTPRERLLTHNVRENSTVLRQSCAPQQTEGQKICQQEAAPSLPAPNS